MNVRLHKAVLISAAALAAGAGVGACGSSQAPGIIPAPSAGLTAQTGTTPVSTTPTTTTPAVTTPTSGPLSKEPTFSVPKGPPPKKLVTKDLIAGTGAVAAKGDTVTVNYVGKLYSNGKVFDASWKRNTTFPFALGAGQVIAGWDTGVAGMRVGGRRELIIPPALAYKAKGQPPTIPPNATLVFVVDLLKVTK